MTNSSGVPVMLSPPPAPVGAERLHSPSYVLTPHAYYLNRFHNVVPEISRSQILLQLNPPPLYGT